MVENIAKISWRMKNKHLLSIEKNIEWEKTPFYNYKKHLLLKIKLEAIFKWKKKLKPYIKIGQKIIKFDDPEIEFEFYQYKSPVSINNTDINKIVVSKKCPCNKQDFKYFINYKNNKEIRPLCILFL